LKLSSLNRGWQTINISAPTPRAAGNGRIRDLRQGQPVDPDNGFAME
jgi:hypothetical protein